MVPRIIRIVLRPRDESRCIGAEAGARGARRWLRALACAAADPRIVRDAAALLVSPLLVTVCVLALVHVLYLDYVGARELLGVPERDAAKFVAIATAIAIGVSTLAGGAIGALALL